MGVLFIFLSLTALRHTDGRLCIVATSYLFFLFFTGTSFKVDSVP